MDGQLGFSSRALAQWVHCIKHHLISPPYLCLFTVKWSWKLFNHDCEMDQLEPRHWLM